MQAACPQCGAPILFRGPLPVRVCDYCRATVVRAGDDLGLAGDAATLPDDVSPIRIGTRGSDEGVGFEVVGRVRWRWTDGHWNEWSLLFADGGGGWLGEAAGRFMLLREVPVTDGTLTGLLRAGAAIVPGMTAEIAGTAYRVTDVRTVTAVASEGALPEPAPAGTGMRSVDLAAADGRCAGLQREGDRRLAAYAGRWRTLADLKPAGLRAIEGWPMPAFAT